MGVLIFADSKDGKINKSSHEAVSYGSKIAADLGSKTTVVTYGTVSDAALKELSLHGANEIIVAKNITNNDSQVLTKLICDIVQEKNADIIVFSQDFTGKAVAPRVSAKLNAGLVSGAVAYPDLSNGFVVKKNVFSGKAFAFCKINSAKKVISVMQNSIGIQTKEGNATISEYTKDLGASKIKIKEIKKKGGDGVVLTDADIVISAGRGLKGPENWGMIENLAKEMGAATACSRPVADIGWRPHHEHVGQTGVTVRPNLYIAIGISGAIQHLAGVNGSKVIVVINSDAEAPFFKAANYGIVGDAFDIIPKLTAAYKKFKEANN